MNTNHRVSNFKTAGIIDRDEPASFEDIECFLASCPSLSLDPTTKNECDTELYDDFVKRIERRNNRDSNYNSNFNGNNRGSNGRPNRRCDNGSNRLKENYINGGNRSYSNNRDSSDRRDNNCPNSFDGGLKCENWNDGWMSHENDNSDDDKITNSQNREKGKFGCDRTVEVQNGRENEDDEYIDEIGSYAKNTSSAIYVPQEKTAEELWSEEGIEKGKNYNSFKYIPVRVTGVNVPRRVTSFVEAGFNDLLRCNLMKLHYDEPTPVQQYSIPIVLAGRDLMASTQTGTGKTGAYLLPTIHLLLRGRSEQTHLELRVSKPRAIVLSPTRELALQIFELAQKFVQGSYLKVRILYGGTSCYLMNNRLKDGCDILIATPGRLIDSLQRNWLDFSRVRFLIIDEADRMLDMGFRIDILKICAHKTMTKPGKRQTLMFSATFPQSVQQLAQQFLCDYIFLAIGIVGSASRDVKQRFLLVKRSEKTQWLQKILDEREDNRGTLVFVETKRNADYLARLLIRLNYAATSIHSDRDQSQRERALRNFKNQIVHILVATSVASRGLDIKGVKHVINVDLPVDVDEYVHRIGRTGRLGNQGWATSFYNRERDARLANDIVKILKQAQQEVPKFLEDDVLVDESNEIGEVHKFGGFDCRENIEAYNPPNLIPSLIAPCQTLRIQ